MTLRGASRLIPAAFGLLMATGCATAMPGLLYSDTSHGIAATANQTGNRVGEACSSSVLGLVSWGDASIETARRNGGITLVSTVDVEATNYFVFFGRYCTIVRGR